MSTSGRNELKEFLDEMRKFLLTEKDKKRLEEICKELERIWGLCGSTYPYLPHDDDHCRKVEERIYQLIPSLRKNLNSFCLKKKYFYFLPLFGSMTLACALNSLKMIKEAYVIPRKLKIETVRSGKNMLKGLRDTSKRMGKGLV